MWRVWLLIVVARIAAAASDPSLDRLQRQIELVAHATDGVAGVSAVHIESRRTVAVRGAEAFPMASAFKLPVAIQLLELVDEGKLSLDKMVALSTADLHPGSGDITEYFFHPGLSISLANLLEVAMAISDNSAADLLLHEAGGPAAVTARMKALNLPGIRVDRPTVQLISDFTGVKELPPESQWTPAMFEKLYGSVPDREHMRARRAQWNDPRDTATPDDMTRLLVRLWSKDLLSAESTQLLLDTMLRAQTGRARLKGLLPAGTPVAHKTGSLGGVVNDVGIITLPGGAGHVAVSVFIKGFDKTEDTAERAVAEIGRTVYDYFALVPDVAH